MNTNENKHAYYIDAKSGRLKDHYNKDLSITPDMNNENHVAAIRKRQMAIDVGISAFSISAKIQCEIRLRCVCGEYIGFDAEASAQVDGEGCITPTDISSDLIGKTGECYNCNSTYVITMDKYDDLLLKIEK